MKRSVEKRMKGRKSKCIIISILFLLLISFIMLLEKESQATERYGEFYELQNNCITRILPETSVQDLKNNLEKDSIQVTNTEGTVLQDNEYVGTGMNLIDDQNTYKISVVGDLDGNGRISITDLSKMKLHVGKLNELEGVYLKSADLNNDGKVSITDLSQIMLAAVNIRDIIAPESFKPEVTTTKDTIVVVAKAVDANSGIGGYYFKLDDGQWQYNEVKTNGIYTFRNVDLSVSHKVTVKIEDKAGNVKKTKGSVVGKQVQNINIIPSTTEWTNENVRITVQYTSNILDTKKMISTDNGVTYNVYTGPVEVEKNTTVIAQIRNMQNEVLAERSYIVANIDKLAPNNFTPELTIGKGEIAINVVAEDAEASLEYGQSGIKEYEYVVKSGFWEWTESRQGATYVFNTLKPKQSYTIKVIAKDFAGNETIAEIDDVRVINECILTFEYNGATAGNAEITREVEYEEAYGELPNPERIYTITYKSNDGREDVTQTKEYEFLGWYKESTFVTEVTSNTIVQTIEDHTIYADWDEYEVEIAAPEEKTGYTFEGWYENSSFEGEKYDAGDRLVLEKNLTLYAKWKGENFGVTYEYNGATAGNLELGKNVTYNQTYGELPTPERVYIVTLYNNDGTENETRNIAYTFGGWYKEDTFETEVTASTTVQTAGVHTIYAKWTEASTNLPELSRQGYIFGGWFENSTFTSDNAYEGGTQYTPTGDISFYAKWSLIDYTIIYDLDGGALAEGITNPIKYNIETETFTLNNPIRDGYTFTGWTGSNGETPQTSVTIEKGSIGNKTYKANWEELPATEGIFATVYDTNNDGVGDKLVYTANSRTIPSYGTKIAQYDITNGAEYQNYMPVWYVYSNYITSAKIEDIIQPINAKCLFAYLPNVTTIENINKLNTTHITDMMCMFMGCDNLVELDLSGFDTNKVTNMSGMFEHCTSLTELDLSSFDTSNVTDTKEMFESCTELVNLNLGSFNTNKITDMQSMFGGCEGLTELDLSNFDITNVTNYEDIFKDCTNLSAIYGNVTWQKVNDTPNGAFDNCGTDHVIIASVYATLYDTNNDGTGDKLVYTTDGRTINSYGTKIEQYDITKTISRVPWQDEKDNITSAKIEDDISPRSCCRLFSSLNNLTEIEGIEKLDTSNVKSLDSMFFDCNNLTSIDLSNFDTSNVTNAQAMFYGCHNLTSIDLSSFDVSNVEIMDSMFQACTALTELDISNFNIEKVNYMRGMFMGCINLVSINLGDICPSATTDFLYISNMFYNCPKLTNLNLSNFNLRNGKTIYTNIFMLSTNLTEIYGNTTWQKVNETPNGAFDNCGTDHVITNSVYVKLYDTDGDGNGDTLTLASVPNMFLDGNSENVVNDYNNKNFAFTTFTINNLPPWHEDKDTINSVQILDEIYPTSTAYWFNDMRIDSLDVGNINTENVVDMTAMFYNCWNLISLDLSSFDTSNVGNTTAKNRIKKPYTSDNTVYEINAGMAEMFSRCTYLENLNLSSFNTSNVTDMSFMFFGCRDLRRLDLSSFDTSNVTNMEGMINSCTFLTNLNISSFDTSNVTNMLAMFAGSSNISELNLSHFNTSNVTNMREMFFLCSKLTSLDLSNFDITKVTNYTEIFASCRNLTAIYGNTTWRKVNETPIDAFDNCGTDHVIINSVYATLYDTDSDGTGDKLVFTTDNRTITEYGEQKEQYDVTNTSTCNVFNSNTKKNITSVDIVDKIYPKSTYYWFDTFTNLTQIEHIENLKTNRVTNMERMFFECSSLTSLNLSNFDTRNVTDMGAMFWGCSSLTSLNLSNFDTRNVTDMQCMFVDCSGLTSIDLSSFDTSNVTTMRWMFLNCSRVAILDLSSFDTSNVTSMEEMFSDCLALTQIKVKSGKWQTSQANTTKMFFRAGVSEVTYC